MPARRTLGPIETNPEGMKGLSLGFQPQVSRQKKSALQEGVTKLVERSLGKSGKIGKRSKMSVPGEGELFWCEITEKNGGLRLAQKSVSPEQYDGVGQQNHDPSQMEAIEKEAS
jgi:hypothetical protein